MWYRNTDGSSGLTVFGQSDPCNLDPDELYVLALRAIQTLGEFQIIFGDEAKRFIRASRISPMVRDNFMEINIVHDMLSVIRIRILDASIAYLPRSPFELLLQRDLFEGIVKQDKNRLHLLKRGCYGYITIGKYLHVIMILHGGGV